MKIIIILTLLYMFFNNNTYAYSKNFEYIIQTMNIEVGSSNGYTLNEEIYNKYNQLIYGSPLDVTSGQRWKDVSDGSWTKGGGAWQGTGTRGEYWILGYNASGKIVHNQKFPVDIEPPTPPTEWRYVYLSDALSSWTDAKKYLYDEQKTYMQTVNLMRNGVTYDITALDIGLDRARAENYPTWKTAGNIYTRRYDINNKEWAANFIVPPMAADAELVSYLNTNSDEYYVSEDEDITYIEIEFGCDVTKLNDYAGVEHIKRIESTLYVDGKGVTNTSGSKTKSVNGKYILKLNKANYNNMNSVQILLENNSILLTEFSTDGPLVDSTSKVITIVFNEEEGYSKVKDENISTDEEVPPPYFKKINLNRITTTMKGQKAITPLRVPNKGKYGFICAGQVLRFDIETHNYADEISIEFEGDNSIRTLDELTKEFEWYEPRERKTGTRYNTLTQLENAYKNKIIIYGEMDDLGRANFYYEYVVPYKTKQTLHSWSTLRELSKNAMEINENKLFSRITEPYTIKIKAYSDYGITTESIKIDVFERWDTIYNRDLEKYIR